MTTLSNVVCLVIHRNVIHRFIVQALQDSPLCSSTAQALFITQFGLIKTIQCVKSILKSLHLEATFFFSG
jgi:hypothetical protein